MLKVRRAKFLGNDGLFCFISICKFGSFKTPFAMITRLSELYFRVKKIYPFSTNGSNWKPWRWVRLDLIRSMRDIYTSISTWIHSQNSMAVAEALSLKISSHGKSVKWSGRSYQSAWEHNAMKQGISLRISWKVNENWANNMIRMK